MSDQPWSTQIDSPLPGGCDVGCQSCAFRADSITRREPYNALRAKVCALGAVPFYCHQGLDGPPGEQYRDQFPPGAPRRVCQGWKQETASLAKQSWWRESLRVRRWIARIALVHIDLAIGREGSLKMEHWNVVHRAVDLLVQRRPRLGSFRKHLIDVRPD